LLREKEEKVGLVWNAEDHTVSYRRQKTWWFVPELSAGPLTDVVTTVNLPMLAASDAARGNFFMEFGLSDMFAAMEVEHSWISTIFPCNIPVKRKKGKGVIVRKICRERLHLCLTVSHARGHARMLCHRWKIFYWLIIT